jgi:hypothetical protein
LYGILDFDRLKRFQVPLVFLVGFPKNTATRLRDFIPRNVELLTITDDLRSQNVDGLERDCPLWDEYAIVDFLRSWLDDAAEFTPHLRQITLMFSDIYPDSYPDKDEWSMEMQDRLRKVGDRAGIQVKLIDLDHDT